MSVESLLHESVVGTNNELSLSGLSCAAYGGLSLEAAHEVVYWEDIPLDAHHVSPLKRQQTQYLTFEPDAGGWNNIHMAMETVLVMAFAMGRTLVLPPEKEMYLLQSKGTIGGEQQRDKFCFNYFFHMEAIHKEHEGLDIISMVTFLETQARMGHVVHNSNLVSFPREI
jgi:hypothetical protein